MVYYSITNKIIKHRINQYEKRIKRYKLKIENLVLNGSELSSPKVVKISNITSNLCLKATSLKIKYKFKYKSI